MNFQHKNLPYIEDFFQYIPSAKHLSRANQQEKEKDIKDKEKMQNGFRLWVFCALSEIRRGFPDVRFENAAEIGNA